MARFSGRLADQQIAKPASADQSQTMSQDATQVSQGRLAQRAAATAIPQAIDPTDPQAQLESMFGATAPAPQRAPAEKDYFGSGIIEPAGAVASGVGRQILGGLTGLGYTSGTGDLEGGVRIIEDMQAGAFRPKTESGQRNLERLGDLMEMGVDVARIPLASIAGIGELITGQGMEQAQQTVQAVQDRGMKAAGERVLEETGNPLLATLAETAPDIAMSIAGIKGVRAAPEVRITTPTKTKIAEMIREGSNDPIVAKYKISEAPSKKIGNYITVGAKEIVDDSTAIKAIDAGFDEGVIAAVKGASKKDNAAMLRMVDLFEKGKKDARFGMVNRASDVAGDTLLDRFRFVHQANKNAGKQIKAVANAELKGKRVNAYDAYSQLIDELDELNVGFADDMTPVFKGSQLEGMSGPQRAVRRIMSRINSVDPNNAFELHNLKLFIDEIVSYGKTSEGLSGQAEIMLKNFRRNIDTVLDNSFPKYNRVNTTYADTISALDALQDVAGKKMNLIGPSADKAVGTLSRRLMSNAQSRVTLYDAIQELEAVAKKYGAQFDDDILTQVLFVDEIDRALGGAARTGFKGQIMQAMQANMPTSVSGVATEAGKAVAKSVLKKKVPDTDAQIKIIRQLLQDQIR